jgi:large subunit ribosomal protein L9
MKVILQKDVNNLGQLGDVVRVRDGYGRNFLIPRGMAVIADERNVRRLEHQKRIAQAKASKEKAKSEALAALIVAEPISLTREAGEDERLYGSVTNRDIAELLAEKGIEVDRRRIVIDSPIKTLGRFEVAIKLPRGVKASLVVFVQR